MHGGTCQAVEPAGLVVYGFRAPLSHTRCRQLTSLALLMCPSPCEFLHNAVLARLRPCVIAFACLLARPVLLLQCFRVLREAPSTLAMPSASVLPEAAPEATLFIGEVVATHIESDFLF